MNMLNEYLLEDSQTSEGDLQPYSQDSTSSAERKRVGIKIGTPEVIELLSSKDIFSVKGARHRMERIKNGKDAREEYLQKAEMNGGDIHYFKVQNFGLTNPRTNKLGVLTPQGEFDLDPEKFIKDNLDAEFEYLGKEIVKGRLGKRTLHHKVLVKVSVLKKCIEEHVNRDEYIAPESGKVLQYVKFFGYICSGSNSKKKVSVNENEKRKIAKANSFDEITLIEKQAIESAEESAKPGLDEVKRRISDLQAVALNQKTVEDMQKYNTMKDTLDFEYQEMSSNLIKRRQYFIEYFKEVRSMREQIEVMKAACTVERNKKRREKRMNEKISRQKVDNNLEDVTSVEDQVLETNDVSSSDIENVLEESSSTEV